MLQTMILHERPETVCAFGGFQSQFKRSVFRATAIPDFLHRFAAPPRAPQQHDDRGQCRNGSHADEKPGK
jgi:hypothetical protein